MSVKPIKVNFVALHFREFLLAILKMSHEERAIYTTLCLQIYDGGGYISSETAFLASLCGFSVEDFEKHFAKIEKKFIRKGEFLTHKRCLTELKNSYKLMKGRSRGGQTTAKLRQNNNLSYPIKMPVTTCLASGNRPQLNETKPNRIEENKPYTRGNLAKPLAGILTSNMSSTDTVSFSVPDTITLRTGDNLILYSALCPFFAFKDNSDKTCLDNICRWAAYIVESGQRDRSFFKNIIGLAEEARRNAKTNRWGFFFNSLRRDFGYVPPSKNNFKGGYYD